MIVRSHVTKFACRVERLINKLKQHLIWSMFEWLTAWEDRVPLALMLRLMTVEVDVIIEKKKDNVGVSYMKNDIRRTVMT